jgi:hypothetical protein
VYSLGTKFLWWVCVDASADSISADFRETSYEEHATGGQFSLILLNFHEHYQDGNRMNTKYLHFMYCTVSKFGMMTTDQLHGAESFLRS